MHLKKSVKSKTKTKTKTKTKKRCSLKDKSKICKYRRCMKKQIDKKMSILKDEETKKSWPKKRQQAIAIAIQYGTYKCKKK